MKTPIIDAGATRSRAMKVKGVALAALLLASALPRAAMADPPAFTPLPPPAPVRRHRSTGMMVAGIVLTSIGSAALVSGAVLTGYFSTLHSEGGGIGVAIIGVPLMIGSTLFAAVGIPLWAVGAPAPRAGTAGTPPEQPRAAASLSFGPGSAAVRLSF